MARSPCWESSGDYHRKLAFSRLSRERNSLIIVGPRQLFTWNPWYFWYFIFSRSLEAHSTPFKPGTDIILQFVSHTSLASKEETGRCVFRTARNSDNKIMVINLKSLLAHQRWVSKRPNSIHNYCNLWIKKTGLLNYWAASQHRSTPNRFHRFTNALELRSMSTLWIRKELVYFLSVK